MNDAALVNLLKAEITYRANRLIKVVGEAAEISVVMVVHSVCDCLIRYFFSPSFASIPHWMFCVVFVMLYLRGLIAIVETLHPDLITIGNRLLNRSHVLLRRTPFFGQEN